MEGSFEFVKGHLQGGRFRMGSGDLSVRCV